MNNQKTKLTLSIHTTTLNKLDQHVTQRKRAEAIEEAIDLWLQTKGDKQ